MKTQKIARLFSVIIAVATLAFYGIQFTAAVDHGAIRMVRTSGEIVVNGNTIDNLTIIPDLVFNKVGDSIIYQLVLSSPDGSNFQIKNVTDNNTNQYIKTSYIYSSEMDAENKTVDMILTYAEYMPLGGELDLSDIEITIDLDEDPAKSGGESGGESGSESKSEGENESESETDVTAPDTGVDGMKYLADMDDQSNLAPNMLPAILAVAVIVIIWPKRRRNSSAHIIAITAITLSAGFFLSQEIYAASSSLNLVIKADHISVGAKEDEIFDVALTGEHTTFSSNPVAVQMGAYSLTTITLDEGYYLADFYCTNNYIVETDTGISVTGTQEVKIVSPGTASGATCTAVAAEMPPTGTINFGAGIYGLVIKDGSLTGNLSQVIMKNTSECGPECQFTELAVMDPEKTYYLIPLYESGYTLGEITASGGTLTQDSENSYGYYSYKPEADTENVIAISGQNLPTAATNDSLPTMQGLEISSCPSVPTALRDIRDNSTYYVQRLADGECWMLENLRLDGGAVLSHSNSHIADESSYTLPNSTTGSFESLTTAMLNSDYKTATVAGYGPGRNYAGVHYNYCAASAGTICTEGSNENANFDICPADWKMPTGGSGGQFELLATALTGSTGEIFGDNAKVYQYALSTPLSGYIYPGSSSETWQNFVAYYWSATSHATNMYSIGVYDTQVNLLFDNLRNEGNNIRCILQR